MSEVAPIRGRRPTSDESDLALIRASIQAQGQLLAALHGELAKLSVEVARIAEVIVPDELRRSHETSDHQHAARGALADAPG